MKTYLPVALGLACLVLAITLVVIKNGDNAQHETDAASITDFSNRLDLAQTQIAIGNGRILTLSNSLADGQSASLMLSNHLSADESTIALDVVQITNLTQQVAGVISQNQALNQRVMDLTNQADSLTRQLTSTQAGLAQSNTNLIQANKDYVLLENRFRRDVAERVVVERKFNNPSELQAQMKNLRKNPADVISEQSIYADLNVEVNSNGHFYVLSPD